MRLVRSQVNGEVFKVPPLQVHHVSGGTEDVLDTRTHVSHLHFPGDFLRVGGMEVQTSSGTISLSGFDLREKLSLAVFIK